jgi:hypothetical protein
MRGIILLTRFLPYAGMSLFPFILLRKKDAPHGERLLNHERIHLRQQLELLILPFYLWYLLDYLIQRIRGRKHEEAYRSIIFEKEAYTHENDLDYLQRRRFWGFLRKKQ